MDNEEHKDSTKNTGQQRQEKADVPGNSKTGNYADHLNRVTPDADDNKALLQARYKALHNSDS